MRIVCPGCHRSHDVSGRPAGTLVTCECGSRFAFPQPPRTLVSLQCSGCGAQADPGDARCGYCDNILKTICCPCCFALMAGSDQHCSACGTQVESPALALHRHGEPTLPCPRCSVALTVRLVDRQLFDRCDRCGGIWTHHLALAALFSDRGQRYAAAQWLQSLGTAAQATSDTSRTATCPDCERTMTRIQLRSHADVAVDCCDDHGVWFDATELRRIIAVRPPQRRRHKRPNRHGLRSMRPGDRDFDDWWPIEVLEELLEFVEDQFD